MRGPDLSGEVFDSRYQMVEPIAEGAMGVVYRGIRLKLERPVAIKVMHSSLPGNMEARKRFEREAKLMARLEHPHCVSVIDFGLHGDKPYVVMELVRGRSLFDVLAEQGKFEIPRAIDVLCQILSGLAHAHDQDIIHRDIKPANIMVTPKAPLGVHVRILDFGLARMLGGSASLSNGVVVGTPSYMAPEQCRGDQPDARVDIYACGVLLFEMLTGKKPFIAGDPIAIVKKHLETMPPRLADVTPGDYGALEATVARALAKSPSDRFPSAVAMAEALDAALAGRRTPEPTIAFAPVGSSALVPIESSVDIPITVGSWSDATAKLPEVAKTVAAVIEDAPPPNEAGDRHSSSVRRMLPRSRMRYFVLAGLVAIAAGIAGIVMLQRRLAANHAVRADHADAHLEPVAVELPDAASDPAAEIVASATKLAQSGKAEAALDGLLKARKQYPDSAAVPLTAGKLYFAKMWWNDGLANLREAIRLEPSLRSDPELIKTAIRGFITTQAYDDRLGRFLVDLGPPVVPMLDETARMHPNPEIRSRAATVLRKLR